MKPNTYVGIDKDINGGMTDTGKVIRAAWVFGLIPEEETCEGWRPEGIQDLWRRVNDEWEKVGFLVGNLPEAQRTKFMEIHHRAQAQAESAGWTGAQEVMDDA